MNCFFSNYRESEVRKISLEEIEQLEARIEGIFLFCYVWSICCTVDEVGREKVDKFVRDIMIEKKSKYIFPDSGTIYDFSFEFESNNFQSWTEKFKDFSIGLL